MPRLARRAPRAAGDVRGRGREHDPGRAVRRMPHRNMVQRPPRAHLHLEHPACVPLLPLVAAPRYTVLWDTDFPLPSARSSPRRGAADGAACRGETREAARFFTTHPKGEYDTVSVHVEPTPVDLSEPGRRNGVSTVRKWLSGLRIGRISQARRVHP